MEKEEIKKDEHSNLKKGNQDKEKKSQEIKKEETKTELSSDEKIKALVSFVLSLSVIATLLALTSDQTPTPSPSEVQT